ncbi:AMP-binding protein [Protaetiibacter sp. SSC-01]|uniref:AMP-binding protein n=1 Tax=Protaetiibacter sp. SSC-01 TaxID=2759943 RepID=UPI001656E935|nr:AMP-binding protein [Protaetiibacter sp. SSC-01]QNO37254.1 AMP-binding protein [Protaetiibacter sp. SSC-01]
MRPLVQVPAAAGQTAVLAALRDALAGGPALFVASGDPGSAAAPLPERVPQQVGLVVETSGTTGRPKRVVLPADAVLASAAASESALGGPAQWLLALPVHYIAGLNVLARSLCAQTEPVALGDGSFTAEAFTAAAARLSPQLPHAVALVPAQLARLLDDAAAREVLRGFQAVLVGGQATPRPLVDRAREAGIPVVRSYGSSETSGGCVYDGRPIGGARVRIVDGEVQLGGATVALGYLDDDALTEQRFLDEGGVRWFRTADAGEWDGETLRVLGRRDDVIVSGGVKVALGAIEEVLRAQPGCADAVVVRVADERWGERPIAYAAGPEVDDAAALKAIAASLGPVARPDRLIRVPELPLLPSGKPDRAALAARPHPQP